MHFIHADKLSFNQVNMFAAVPPIITFLNKHPMVAKADLSSLRRVTSAAAPLGPEMVDEFHAKLPNCTLAQGETLIPSIPIVYWTMYTGPLSVVRSAAVYLQNATSFMFTMKQRHFFYLLAVVCVPRKILTKHKCFCS